MYSTFTPDSLDGKLTPNPMMGFVRSAKTPAPANLGSRGYKSSTPRSGALLLYPLDPKLAGAGAFPNRTKPILGFGVSFPSSESGVKVEYKVDHIIWGQWELEYGASE